jgi:hypothetical protein
MTSDERRTAIQRAQTILEEAEGWVWIVPAATAHLARMADHIDDAPVDRARLSDGLEEIANRDRSFRNAPYARELHSATRAFRS